MENKIKEVISAVFDVEESEISEKTLLSDFANYDSLGYVNLLAALEEEFDCSFDFEEIQNIESFVQIVELVKKYK
jgi:acyl carrier protein